MDQAATARGCFLEQSWRNGVTDGIPENQLSVAHTSGAARGGDLERFSEQLSLIHI